MDNITIGILAGVVFAAASMLQGITGFGFSLLSVSILTLVLGPKTAVPLNLVAATANCFYLTYLLRRQVQIKQVAPLLLIVVLFVPAGALFLSKVDRSIVLRVLGMVILVLAILSLTKGKKTKLFGTRPFKWIAGIFAGLLGGAYDMPGPPLVLYAYNCDWDVRNAIANLQFIFAVVSVVAFPAFWFMGLMTPTILGWGAIYAPIVVAFSLLGAKISGKLKTETLVKVINIVLLVLGVSLIIKG